MKFSKSCATTLCVLLATSAVWAQPQPGDYSPAKYEVVEELDRPAPMRDGVELMLDIFRPKDEGRFPAILQQTPYNKSGGAARAKRFSARGYVVINVDSRGRFRSGGDWDPFTPLHKSDGYDLVEWVAKQPWCTGNVGTYGLSYMGWTQWWTATQAPPSLKAIVPEVAPPDHFFNCPYQNGIFVCWMMDWAGNMSGRTPHSAGPGPYGGFAVNREQAYRQTPYIDFDKSRKYLPTDWWRKWITQNTSTSEYWSGIAYQTPESYARVMVPSLAITGWFDANFNGSPLNYAGMKQHGGTPAARQPRMVIGPWEHIINTKREAAGIDFGPQALIDWDGYVCRWFDFHLKGIDNGVLNDPPIHLFVMGRNQWRTATDWPLPETQFTKFFLHSGGQANSSSGDGRLSPESPGDEKPDRFTYDPDDPTPSAGFTNGHIDGPRDISSSAARKDVLVYTTAELTEDVELIGPITAKLYAATSARDTDWMIRLSDVHPDGRALFLAEGVMRARHRDPQRGGAFNPERLSTITPDQAYEYSIDFWRPTGNRFARGHRIRIEISSSYYPYFLRNLNTGEDNIGLATKPVIARQTIFHDSSRSSHIVLPVIPVGKNVGFRKQLFVDDFVVAEKQRVTRVLGQVTKANDGQPIFTDGWFYGSVLHDEGKFKLWFRKPGTNGFGYAESLDGLTFKKQADVQGINFAGDYTLAVEIDSAETDPQHRFKAGYDAPGMAAGIAHSADGIRWTPYHDGKPVTKRAADTYNQILWDPKAKTYRLFTRTDFGTAGGSTELRGTRSMTNPAPKTNPANWSLVREWIFDKEGKSEAQRRQIYATTCWIYHGVYFALLSVYDHPGDVSEGKVTDTRKRHERDVMNFYIATSRDGDAWDTHWVYVGQPLVPRGPEGAFDKDIVLPASTIVTHADKHWLYYAGANERHGNEQVKFDRKHAIGLATLRLDGFVGLSAGKSQGTVVTKPFKLEGDKLMINVDAHGGEVSVEVLDEAGQPLAGYSGDETVPVSKRDEIRWRPQWKKHVDLSALQNKVVRLKFRLRDAKLYSFQIGGEPTGR